MKFQANIEQFEANSLLWMAYIPIPEEVYQSMLKVAPDKRIRCILNNSYEQYSAMMSSGELRFIMLNKAVLKALGVAVGDKIAVELQTQDLQYGVPISQEMEEVLNTDYEGSEYFHKLPMGAQRSLILMIGKFKNPQLRIDRSLILMRHLVARQGKIDNQALRDSFREGI